MVVYRNVLAAGLALALLIGLFAGCAQPTKNGPVAAVQAPAPAETASAEPVVLTVAGGWSECRALDIAARAFTEKYPNCTIVYEYLQDYYASLEKRMGGEAPVDLFFTTNIQADSALLPYALDLNACEGLDLTDAFDGLIENFTFRADTDGPKKLYALPLGAEMRGMYVNMTLLKSLGIEAPTDQASLLSACETLKQNGYIPFHGNPGSFAQTLVYPWICNLIVNSDDPQAAHDRVEAREPGVSELFRAPYAFLYTLVENGYYDYKRAQTELDLFNETTDEDYARYFLNIQKQGDDWAKADDLGMVAFMPSPLSLHGVIDKTKDDYHSGIEYVFMLAPVGPDGGYAYLSPAHGIAANRGSVNAEWSVRFLDFLFKPENNTAFAEAFGVIPNTKDAFTYIRTLYDVPDSRIAQLGQVTFDYGFYETVQPSMTDVSKANNPKYMQDDGKGNLSLYPFDYYMKELEDAISQQ